jgi:hypothetical protein
MRLVFVHLSRTVNYGVRSGASELVRRGWLGPAVRLERQGAAASAPVGLPCAPLARINSSAVVRYFLCVPPDPYRAPPLGQRVVQLAREASRGCGSRLPTFFPKRRRGGCSALLESRENSAGGASRERSREAPAHLGRTERAGKPSRQEWVHADGRSGRGPFVMPQRTGEPSGGS